MTLFSGIQPSGNLHIGNYLGAIKNWLKLQEQFDPAMFCIVDLHAITSLRSPTLLRESIIDSAATYIACGIDTERSTVFLQSSIPEHTQLTWLLCCITSTGSMNRMTQFKDKTDKNASLNSLGLYSYPVLMAADILLYKTTHVPVGDDQKQHIELTRDLANLFNSRYSVEYFPVPQAIFPEFTSRVMSLRNGTVKMSKSDPIDYSRINLSDTPDLIRQKISKAKSDSVLGFDIETLPGRPEARNLINIYSSLSNSSIESACEKFNSFSILKSNLTDLIIEKLSTIRTKFTQLKKEPNYIKQILNKGQERAQNIASLNFKDIKNIIGMYY